MGGWYDSFGGKTERINMNNFASGSAAKNFGDAFASIGKIMIDNEVAKDNAKLTDLKVQNEQNRLDEFKDGKKQKKFDDAFALDIKTLDSSASPEATQNAVDALKSFHAPSVQAVAQQEQEIKAKATDFQNTQNKQYLGDAWTLDATASKEARQNATDALSEFYKPDTTTQDKATERFKGLDNIAQTKFNDEAIEVSVSKGYKNMKEFTEANPELVKNSDGSTMAKIDTYFAGKDTTARDLADRLKEIKTATTIQNLQGNVAEAQIRAAKGSGSGADGEKDTKIVDAINKIIITKFGKADGKGMVTMPDDKVLREKANTIGSRALEYASQGKSASAAYVQAEKDWDKMQVKVPKSDDPLGIRVKK